MSKQRGNRRITIRANGDLHKKLATVASNAGVDRSTVARFAIGWLNEDQLVQLISAQRGQHQRVVNHAQ